jgi:hypothetical protein
MSELEFAMCLDGRMRALVPLESAHLLAKYKSRSDLLFEVDENTGYVEVTQLPKSQDHTHFYLMWVVDVTLFVLVTSAAWLTVGMFYVW